MTFFGLVCEEIRNCYHENSRPRPGSICRRETKRQGVPVEFRAITQPVCRMYADLAAKNPQSVPSLSTFYRKKPRNIVKPNRPSDLCKYCFKKPQVEGELGVFLFHQDVSIPQR